MTEEQERLNPSTRIKQVITIRELALMVYYTSGKYWKYAIAGNNGSYESESIYYTAEAAEREGREQIKALLS